MRRNPIVIVLLAVGLVTSSAFAADIVEAAKANGSFTKLLAANEAAGTTSLLEGPGPFTVFAPNDAAFAKVPADKIARLMQPAEQTMLRVTLANHVVTGLLTKDQIDQGLAKADSIVVMAANNMPLVIKREGSALTVNGAHVIEGPMQVANGLIYVVDAVIVPAMPVQAQY